ncbi:MAG: YcaQ family DNA glycosylase [Thermoflexales bacterium]|nr:YcaQ family DNA glycosylase [Thermoflexales bacterium]
MRTLSLATVRKLALVKQRLASQTTNNDAAGILALVRDLGCLQLDPISAVARSHQLVVWSRVGQYDLDQLDQLLWRDRSLFEYWAHMASIVPVADYPIHQHFMRRYATDQATGRVSQRYAAWLTENQSLKRHILQQIKKHGPLPSRELEAENKVSAGWYSTGWTSGRDVSQMLDYLWTKGKIMVAGRTGIQKLWDLSERCLPDWTPRETLNARQVTYRAAQTAVKALGAATAQQIKWHYVRHRYEDLPHVLKQLVSDGRLEQIHVADQKGAWYMHADDAPLLDQLDSIDFSRTTLLSPFDNLICDRARTSQLFNFDFRIEIYVPQAKRKFGYYVLPILHGDQIIGRIDPKFDREHSRLHIHAVHAEADAPKDRATARSVRGAIENLASFLGAGDVHYTHLVPSGWQRDLK